MGSSGRRAARTVVSFGLAAAAGALLAPASPAAVTHIIEGLTAGTYDVLQDSASAGSFELIAAPVVFADKTLEFDAEGGGAFRVALTGAADVVAPAAVPNLAAASGLAHGEVALTWEATGDDGLTGIAASYLVRVAPDSITEASWSAAVNLPGAPVPGAPGTPEAMTVAGLTPGQRYWFAVRALDDWTNLSPMAASVTALAADLVPPAIAADLSAAGGPGGGDVRLQWTAPGDDGPVGLATAYHIRSAADSITEASWDAATPVAAPAVPAAPGTPEVWIVTGLNPGQTYWFTLRTLDDAGNESPLSPSRSAQASISADVTAPAAATGFSAAAGALPGEVTLQWFAPGDDGLTGFASAYQLRAAADSITEATFAAAAPLAVPAVPAAPGVLETWTVGGLTPGESYWFALRALDDAANESPLTPSVRVRALDHALTADMGVLQNPILPGYLEIIVLVSRPVVDASVVVVANGDTLAAEPGDPASGVYHVAYRLDAPGVVSFTACAADSFGDEACFTRDVAVELIAAGPGGLVRSPDGSATLAVAPGAFARDERVILSARPGTNGAAPAAGTDFDRVLRVYEAGPRWARAAGGVELRVSLAAEERGGLPAENAAIELEAGGAWRSAETFLDPATGELVARAEEIGNFRVGVSASRALSQVLPRSLALEPNSPNPFGPATGIRYSLPRREPVDLAVFDVAGRLVVRLVEGMQGPGSGFAIWNGRDARGAEVAPGVYVFRLRAGSESVARKMVMVK